MSAILSLSVLPEPKPPRLSDRKLPEGPRRMNPASVPTMTLTTVIDLDITDGCNLA